MLRDIVKAIRACPICPACGSKRFERLPDRDIVKVKCRVCNKIISI